jgi:hypothetical protein
MKFSTKPIQAYEGVASMYLIDGKETTVRKATLAVQASKMNGRFQPLINIFRSLTQPSSPEQSVMANIAKYTAQKSNSEIHELYEPWVANPG